MERWCRCQCHRVNLGDANAALQYGDLERYNALVSDVHFAIPYFSHVEDAVDAAVASGCPCIVNHGPALIDPNPNPKPKNEPPYKPPTKWEPSDDD